MLGAGVGIQPQYCGSAVEALVWFISAITKASLVHMKHWSVVLFRRFEIRQVPVQASPKFPQVVLS